MATHVRKNVMLPKGLDDEIRMLAADRRTSQSSLLVHLVRLGMAAESSQDDPLLGYLGAIDGPPDLSQTIDDTVYRR